MTLKFEKPQGDQIFQQNETKPAANAQ
jgi:hypothetical protein